MRKKLFEFGVISAIYGMVFFMTLVFKPEFLLLLSMVVFCLGCACISARNYKEKKK